MQVVPLALCIHKASCFLAQSPPYFFQMPLLPGFQSILYEDGLRTFSQKICSEKPALQCIEISRKQFDLCLHVQSESGLSPSSAMNLCNFHQLSQSSNRICRSLINSGFLTSVSNPRSNNASGAMWHTVFTKVLPLDHHLCSWLLGLEVVGLA